MATWNKFCFTGGLVETSVTLPGYNNIVGLWPAVWAMGNLGNITPCFTARTYHQFRAGRLRCQSRRDGMLLMHYHAPHLTPSAVALLI